MFQEVATELTIDVEKVFFLQHMQYLGCASYQTLLVQLWLVSLHWQCRAAALSQPSSENAHRAEGHEIVAHNPPRLICNHQPFLKQIPHNIDSSFLSKTIPSPGRREKLGNGLCQMGMYINRLASASFWTLTLRRWPTEAESRKEIAASSTPNKLPVREHKSPDVTLLLPFAETIRYHPNMLHGLCLLLASP